MRRATTRHASGSC